MSSFPCLARFVSGSGQVRYRLGDRLVDRYLEFVAGRCRPNTLRAVAFDLKTFFSVTGKDPVEVTAADVFEFLAHQRAIGNDLSTPVPEFQFPGLVPGDRWCVTAANWLRAHRDGAAAPVVLASTHERALEIVPMAALASYAVDVPADPSALED